MKIIKQAVRYYVYKTGNIWEDFYSNLDEALLLSDDAEDSDLWLINRLVKTINTKGVTTDTIKSCKDTVKSEFDHDGRTKNGEYFTPEVWCKEGRTYLEKYVEEWGNCIVWDASCGSGNLMRSSNYPNNLLYLSTLQESDVKDINNSSEYEGATAFNLDFVNGIDYDEVNTEFVDTLPQGLQDAIRGDKPIVFYMNPPYKLGNSKDNELGSFMLAVSQGLDYSKAACDIYYQFLYRVMRLVDIFELSNVYLGVFGPVTLFTGEGLKDFHSEFQKYFKFLDGMCISSREFSDTSEDYAVGIGYTVWKSLGGYIPDKEKDAILLEEKYLVDGEPITRGRVLFDTPRVRLSDWVEDKTINYYTKAPSLTSHLTFKGQEPMIMKSDISHKIAVGALCSMMYSDTVSEAGEKCCLLSSATPMQNQSVTEANFWRAVASFAFRVCYTCDWQTSKRSISAPNTNIEGYQEWLYNCIPLFLFYYRNRTSSLRGVEYGGELIDIQNQLFYLSADDVRSCCSDEVVLADLDSHPPVNDFMLSVIQESKPYWSPLQADLFNKCVELTKATYVTRGNIGYKGCTQAWDAGFHQLRVTLDLDDKTNADLLYLFDKCRQELLKPAMRFGFLENTDYTEVIKEEDVVEVAPPNFEDLL